MKSSSDRFPDVVVLSNERTQIRYNVSPVTKQDMDGMIRTVYEFDYVEISGDVTKEKIVEAILLVENPEPAMEIVQVVEEKAIVNVDAVRVMAVEAVAEAAERLRTAPDKEDVVIETNPMEVIWTGSK